jgi:hypothetical protein
MDTRVAKDSHHITRAIKTIVANRVYNFELINCVNIARSWNSLPLIVGEYLGYERTLNLR